MKNSNNPYSATLNQSQHPKSISDIYRDDSPQQQETDLAVTTSVKLKVSTKNRLKAFAAITETTMGEVMDQAINQWIDQHQPGRNI